MSEDDSLLLEAHDTHQHKAPASKLDKHRFDSGGPSVGGSTRLDSRIPSETASETTLMSLHNGAWPAISSSGSLAHPESVAQCPQRQEEVDDLLEDALADSWDEDDLLGLDKEGAGSEGSEDGDDEDDEEEGRSKVQDLDNASVRGVSAYSDSKRSRKSGSTRHARNSRNLSDAKLRPSSPSISRLIGVAESEFEKLRKAHEDSARPTFNPSRQDASGRKRSPGRTVD
mmetsp:Transcript_24110/g.60175  ORF Transcript_24110/g.60175 Transcript_24110/m.60175 type:complete len:228 (+) Transcript_24110:52-735(+)